MKTVYLLAIVLSIVFYILHVRLLYIFAFFILALLFIIFLIIGIPGMFKKKAVVYIRSRPFASIIFSSLVLLMLVWGMNPEGIIFFSFFLSLLIFRLDTRISAGLALLFLTLCPLLLFLKMDSIAEQIAIYAYYLLVIFVVCELLETANTVKKVHDFLNFIGQRKISFLLGGMKMKKRTYKHFVFRRISISRAILIIVVVITCVLLFNFLKLQKQKPIDVSSEPQVYIPKNVVFLDTFDNLTFAQFQTQIPGLNDADFAQGFIDLSKPTFRKLFPDKNPFTKIENSSFLKGQLLIDLLPLNVYYREENDNLTVYTMSSYALNQTVDEQILSKIGKNILLSSSISNDLFFLELNGIKTKMQKNKTEKIGEATKSGDVKIYAASPVNPARQQLLRTLPIKYEFQKRTVSINLKEDEVFYLDDRNDLPDPKEIVSPNVSVYLYTQGSGSVKLPVMEKAYVKGKAVNVVISAANDPFFLVSETPYDVKTVLSLIPEKFDIFSLYLHVVKYTGFEHMLIDNMQNGWLVDPKTACAGKNPCTKNKDGSYNLSLEIR